MATHYNIGQVLFAFKGEWSEETAYAALDCVTYGGSTYACKQDAPAGTAPTETEYWFVMAQKSTGIFVYDNNETDETILAATNGGDIIFRLEEVEETTDDDGSTDDGTDAGENTETL